LYFFKNFAVRLLYSCHFFVIFRVKGQSHQAALLTAALTREAGAAVTVRTYWAWETTATLRLLGGARDPWALGAHGGGEGRGHIVVSLRV